MLTVLPLGISLLLALMSGAKGVSIGIVGYGRCPGWEIQGALWRVPGLGYLRGLPILVVGPAFVVWLRTRWRWPAWAASGLLALNALVEPVLLGYDAVTEGDSCLQLWGPFADWTMGWQLWNLLPAALIAATVMRWSRVLRGVAATAVLLSVLVVTGDRGRDEVVAIGREECRAATYAQPARNESWVEAVRRMPPHDRERAFLCSMRGGPWQQVDERPDGELLWLGRRSCENPENMRRLFNRSPAEPGRVLAYLCPERAGPALTRSEQQVAEENARLDARKNAHCRKKVPRRDRANTKAVLTTDGGGYYVGGGEMGLDPMYEAIKNGLVGVHRHGVAVTTAEHHDFCLTVRRAKARPPVERAGWDRVVEVGIDSPGPVRFTTMEEVFGFPSVGQGSLRIRIHVRDAGESPSELPRERHLVVVFPGSSKKTVVY
ncbi:hypothetical protein SMC26_45185 [Actinomadura fulvescens]|uniref:CN hydrolase domain-containing protein n=1 Tax=Actinomadura fulvescens TaxID=46160 RepID=A0ABN3R0R6_9ACTN